MKIQATAMPIRYWLFAGSVRPVASLVKYGTGSRISDARVQGGTPF